MFRIWPVCYKLIQTIACDQKSLMNITAFVVLFYLPPAPPPPPHSTPKVFGFARISGVDQIGVGGGQLHPIAPPPSSHRGDANDSDSECWFK